jgi:hypothetical protein
MHTDWTEVVKSTGDADMKHKNAHTISSIEMPPARVSRALILEDVAVSQSKSI